MRLSRWGCPFAASLLLTLSVAPAPAFAADYCANLRAQLAQLGRAALSPAQELRSAEAQASRLGCFNGFGFFGPPPSGRCYALMARINSLRADSWAGGSTFGWDGGDLRARQSGLRRALDRAGCNAPRQEASGYRTLCVRSCDGYYFPISNSTSQSRFKTDDAVCKSMYPPDQAELYVHRTTTEDASQAVSLAGVPYAKQSFAFAYRSSYDRSCAALFRSGSSALVAVKKSPVPASVVAAYIAGDGSRSGTRSPERPPAAAEELPANLDRGVLASEQAEPLTEAPGIRTVGPHPDAIAATEGEPPKLALPPDTSARGAAPTGVPPVAASVLPNPLDFLLKPRTAPPPIP